MSRRRELDRRRAALSEAGRALFAERLRRPGSSPAATSGPSRATRAGSPREEGSAPLSLAQERYWNWARSHPERSDHNLYHLLALAGPLDGSLLRASLEDLVARHESLRSRIEGAGGDEDYGAENRWSETARLVVEAPGASPLPLLEVDCSGVTPASPETGRPSLAAAQARAVRLALELARPVFDLEAAPPLRLALLTFGPEAHALVLVAHHLILDARSLDLLARELRERYRTRWEAGGSAPLEPPPVQMGDVAAWQRQRLADGRFDRDLAWWREHLKGAAPPSWSAAPDRPKNGGFRRTFELTPEVTDPLRRLAASQDTTLFAVVTAALAATVGAVTGDPRVTVGTPLALRQRPETRRVVGLLLNLLPLPVDLVGDPSFRELVGRAAAVHREGLARGEAPIEALVRELDPAAAQAGEVPWVKVLCTLLTEEPAAAAVRSAAPAGSGGSDGGGSDGGGSDGGGVLQILPWTTGEMGSDQDLTCHARELASGGLRLDLGLARRRFDRSAADRLARGLQKVLEAGAAHDHLPPAFEAAPGAEPEGRPSADPFAEAGGEGHTEGRTEGRSARPGSGRPADPTAVVVGAGLIGTLAAIMLSRRGYRVEVIERRGDLRCIEPPPGRSINITLATRGFTALDRLGVGDAVRRICVPLYRRVIHDSQGVVTDQPYGNREEAIHSVSRNDLNRVLVEEAESRWPILFRFRHRSVKVETETALGRPALTVEDLDTGRRDHLAPDLLLAADGAFSGVRRQLQGTDRFDFSQFYVGQGYRELKLPPGAEGDWVLDPNALHLWPRGRYMLIGFPNVDGSFTLALHLPFEGTDGPSFASITSAEDLQALFAREFPDVVGHIPRLAESFFAIKTTSMVTIRCSPWVHGPGLALIGDAAHAIVPSYGQGANCGFEDVRVLDDCLEAAERSGSSLRSALDAYERRRKPNAEAIADLSLRHFRELQEHVSDPLFLLRKQVERRLEALYPDHYLPLYSMVSFTDMTYVEALEREARQRALVDELMAHGDLDHPGSTAELDRRIQGWIDGPLGRQLELLNPETGPVSREVESLP